MDVSIIIVNFNTKEVTRNCLASIYEKTSGIDFEVIVSDNGSVDGSVEMIKKDFPQVVLLENNANLGFGRANNKGLDVAKGKYVFYLNSDTILLNNAVKDFYDYWENNQIELLGALGGILLDRDRNPGRSFGFFKSYGTTVKEKISSIKNFYLKVPAKLILKKLGLNYKKKPADFSAQFCDCQKDVDFIVGADLFMLNNDMARFDDRYFMYSEERDMQYKLMKKGLIRRIITGPKIIHLEKQSDKGFNDKIQIELYKKSNFFEDISLIKFWKYNYSWSKGFGLKILTLIVWLNPFLVKNSVSYFGQLLKI